MESPSSLLESIYSTWLSISPAVWAMDIVLAFVSGLGLYLLLLPFLESHLWSPPPTLKSTRKPQMQKMTCQRRCRKRFRNHSRKNPKAWRECLKKLQKKEKDGLFLEKMNSPLHQLNSLGNMFNSSSAKEDSTTFWNLKEKSEQQMATQKLSYPKILGDHFQQKYNQLFWGLPTLHSESIVAAAWIPQTASTLPSPFFLFNVISSVYPDQFQDKMSPIFSHTHPLSYLDLRAPPLILSSPQFQTPALNQVHLQPALPALPPSPLPYTRDYGTPCSQPQSKPHDLPSEIQGRERSSLTKHLGSRLALPLMAQRPQEVCDIMAPNLSHDWEVSILPDNFPISSELREKLEQHIQKWLIQHHWDFPPKTQESLGVMQLQSTVTETHQAKEKPGPSPSFMSSGEHSKDGYKVRFQLEREPGKNLGPILGMISKDPARGLEKLPGKAQGANLLESERSPVKCLKSNSRSDSTKNLDRNLENTLKAHLGTKSRQINGGLIPLSVRRSWLAMNKGFSTSDSNMKTRHLTASKSSEKSTSSSSQKLAFLDPGTRQALEAHVVKLRVKHRWSLPLRILKPVSLFKLKHAESLPVAPRAQPSSTASVHWDSSAVEVARFLGKPSRTCLREMIIEDSSSSLGNFILVSSPSCKGSDKALRRLHSDVDHEPSKVLLTKPESRNLSETLTCNFMGTPSQSGTVLEKEIETQEVLLLPRRTSVQTSRAYSLQAKVVSECPHNMETDSAGQLQIYSTAELLPEHSRSPLLPADTLASRVLGDIVAEGDNSPMQQKPSTPKHQVSKKDQVNVLTSTYQGEDTKRRSKGKHEERSNLTGVKEKEDNFRSKYHQPLPNTTQVLPESPFQKLVSRFLRWIHPKKAIKGQEPPPQKGKPTEDAAQSQQRKVKKKPHTDSNVAEAQELMTAVGQVLEKKMMLQRKLCASKFNQNREAPPIPTSQFSCDHKPVSYSKQRRAPSHLANSSCLSHSIQERHIGRQLSQKNVRFSKEPQTQRNPHLLYPNTPLNLVNPSQNRTRMPGISSHHLHCPKHCALQRSVCSQLKNSSLVFF